MLLREGEPHAAFVAEADIAGADIEIRQVVGGPLSALRRPRLNRFSSRERSSRAASVGLMTAIIPTNNVALGTLLPGWVKNASGLYNLTRNLRGAVGLAGLTTILNDRTNLHLARLHEKLTFASRPAVDPSIISRANFQSYGSDAQGMALKQLMQSTHVQGVVMAFADLFFLLTLLFVALAALTVVVKKPAGQRPG
jgi:MFS transporter, DHA2 family, multidrug resistance protein